MNQNTLLSLAGLLTVIGMTGCSAGGQGEPPTATGSADKPSALNAASEAHSERQWSLNQIRVQPAWQRATGKGVVIAIVDTGVRYGHPEFQLSDGTSKFVPGNTFFSTISDDLIDETANEPCADIDCGQRDGADDEDGTHSPHGTGVASVAAAPLNGYGMVGVAPDAQLMSVRVVTTENEAQYVDIAYGIRWAVDNGAHVINLSLATIPGIAPIFLTGAVDDFGVADAVQHAVDSGVVVVAAAGNYFDPFCAYPALVDGVICATGTLRNELPSGYTHGGIKPDGLTLAAPSGFAQPSDGEPSLRPLDDVIDCEERILVAGYHGPNAAENAAALDSCPSVGDGSDYRYSIGTSYAAPQIAGLAALLFEMGCTSTQAIDLMIGTARLPVGDVPEAAIPYYGYGIIDADAATLAAEEVCAQ